MMSENHITVNLLTKSKWKGKEGIYKTLGMIFSEFNLIFPLPFT